MSQFRSHLLRYFTPVLCLLGALLLSRPAINRAGFTSALYGNDFTVFYAAAESLLQSGNPYQHAIAAHTPYLYPPLFALLLAPLALCSLPTAATLWYWLNIFSTGLLMWLLIPNEIAREQRVKLVIILPLMVSRIVIDNLMWGQVNILIALLIVGWMRASLRKSYWLAATLLAVAISIKITPALLVVYLFGKRRFGEVARVIACLVIVNLISLIPLGATAGEQLQGWFNRTILNGQGFNWAYAGNQSLRAALERLFTDSNTETACYPQVNLFSLDTDLFKLMIGGVMALLLISSGILINKQRQNGDADRFEAEVALTCVLMLLLSNLSWKAHFILMAIPWAVLLKQTLKQNSRRSSCLVGLLVSGLLCNLTSENLIGAPAQQWFEVYSYYAVVGLISLALLFQLIMNSFSPGNQICLESEE